MEKPSDYLPLVLARFAEEKYEKDFSQLNDFEAAKQIAFDYKTTVDDIAEYMYSEKNLGEQYDESMTLSEIKHGLQVQRTILTQLVTIKLWSQNKQAYLFDADFLDELMNTDNVAFSKEIVKHLPYTTFYLDFADNERARKLIGADGIVVLALSEEQEYLYCVLVSRQSQSIHTDMIPISFAGLTDKEYYISKDEWFKKDWKIVDLSFNPIDDDNSKPILSKEGNFLLLQIMTYLSSAEPDIRENPKQHIIYRKPKPGDKIRNVPTELQK